MTKSRLESAIFEASNQNTTSAARFLSSATAETILQSKHSATQNSSQRFLILGRHLFTTHFERPLVWHFLRPLTRFGRPHRMHLRIPGTPRVRLQCARRGSVLGRISAGGFVSRLEANILRTITSRICSFPRRSPCRPLLPSNTTIHSRHWMYD